MSEAPALHLRKNALEIVGVEKTRFGGKDLLNIQCWRETDKGNFVREKGRAVTLRYELLPELIRLLTELQALHAGDPIPEKPKPYVVEPPWGTHVAVDRRPPWEREGEKTAEQRRVIPPWERDARETTEGEKDVNSD